MKGWFDYQKFDIMQNISPKTLNTKYFKTWSPVALCVGELFNACKYAYSNIKYRADFVYNHPVYCEEKESIDKAVKCTCY